MIEIADYQHDHAYAMKNTLASYRIHQELAEVEGIYFKAVSAIRKLECYAKEDHMNKGNDTIKYLKILRNAIRKQIIMKANE